MKAAARSTPTILKRILFATDYSDAAKRAQSYATSLAHRFGAKLLVVHAKEPPNYALPPESWRSADDIDARELQELQKSLHKSFPDLKSEFHVGEGSAWQVVEAILKNDNVDLIVLGTRGRTGFAKLVMGSQAEKILRRSLCPVLTVGPHSREISGGKNELTEVLYATDFSPESQVAASYAISISLGLGAHLSLLHVVSEPKAGELVNPEEITSSSARLLKSLITRDAEFWREPRCLVETGVAAEKILEVAERIHASLIVLGVRKSVGIPGAATHLGTGVAHKVVSAATCPVLTVGH
jgi:nucleotide-binding universal stress UspA family protein